MGEFVFTKVKGYPFWPAQVLSQKAFLDAVHMFKPKVDQSDWILVEFFNSRNKHGFILPANIVKLDETSIAQFEKCKSSGFSKGLMKQSTLCWVVRFCRKIVIVLVKFYLTFIFLVLVLF